MLKIKSNYFYLPYNRSIVLLNEIGEENINEIRTAYSEGNLSEIEKNTDLISSNKQVYGSVKTIPLNIHIFPTYDCNLNCRYCYSDAGHVKSRSLSKSQIYSFIKNAAKTAYLKKIATNMDEVDMEIHFAGGGEPTHDWDLLIYSINVSNMFADKYGYKVNYGIVTNGFVNDIEKLEFLSENFKYIQISFDGYPDIQDSQRPAVSGTPSSYIVENAINFFLKRGNVVGIRSTITKKSVNNLPDIVSYFIDNFNGISHIQVEPLSMTEKSIRVECTPPSPDEYVNQFINALKIATNRHVPLLTSVGNLHVLRENDSFCDAAEGHSLILNPDGIISTCYEASTDNMEISRDYFVGSIDNDGVLRWNGNELNQCRQVYSESCNKCLAWHYCKGGCSVSMRRGNDNRRYKCTLTRKLIRNLLLEITNGNAHQIGVELYESKPKDVVESYIDKVFAWKEKTDVKKLKLSDI